MVHGKFSVSLSLCFAVPHNNRYILLPENISLYLALQKVFLLRRFILLHPTGYFTTLLQSIPYVAVVLYFHTKRLKDDQNKRL